MCARTHQPLWLELGGYARHIPEYFLPPPFGGSQGKWVAQDIRVQSSEKTDVASKAVEDLILVDFVKEVKYTT